jgi:pyruvate dehydrogenase E1 component beta subunit
MAVEALIAAKALANESINVEVIDMRSVRPLDVETVAESVRKTGRLLVADTAFETGGIAGELVSQVVHAEWRSLKAAPERLASPDYPVPTSPYLAEDYYPGAQEVVTSVFRLLGSPKELESNFSTIAESVRPSMPLDVPNKSFRGPF